jgi:hypothetical protein
MYSTAYKLYSYFRFLCILLAEQKFGESKEDWSILNKSSVTRP